MWSIIFYETGLSFSCVQYEQAKVILCQSLKNVQYKQAKVILYESWTLVFTCAKIGEAYLIWFFGYLPKWKYSQDPTVSTVYFKPQGKLYVKGWLNGWISESGPTKTGAFLTLYVQDKWIMSKAN